MKRVPKLEFYQDTAAEWRWRFRAANSRILAVSSEGYVRRRDCIHAWEILRNAVRQQAGRAPGTGYGVEYSDPDRPFPAR